MKFETDQPRITGCSVSRHGVTDGNQAVATNGFRTLLFPAVHFNDGNFDPATSLYTVPEAGYYRCTARIRMADGEPHYSYGLGVHVANVDGPWFLWSDSSTNPSGSATKRTSQQVARFASFAAGDQIRAYVYVDYAASNRVVAAAALDIEFAGSA